MGSDRNAPCPCGSGRKSKKCCLAAAPQPSIPWRTVLARVGDALLADAHARLASWEWLQAFHAYDRRVDDLTEEQSARSVLPWVLTRWRPGSLPGGPPAGLRADETFAERALRKRRDLSVAERRLLEASCSEPASWWVVGSGTPDGVMMRDVFRGVSRRLDAVPVESPEGAIMHARILELDGCVLPVEVAPRILRQDTEARIARLREHLEAPDPVTDAWLLEHDDVLRTAFLRATESRPETSQDWRLAFTCIDLGDAALEDVLSRLTTGLERDPSIALRALDEDVLRWRPVDPSTGLPEHDAAWLIRRGAMLELRARDSVLDFGHVLQAVTAQLEGSGARVLEPGEALRHVLDGIVPEEHPAPERALLRRFISMEREAWGDLTYASTLAEPNILSGMLLPTPDVLAVRAFARATLAGHQFVPGDDLPETWFASDTAFTRALRLGLLSDAEREALAAIMGASVAPWRVIEAIDPVTVRISARSRRGLLSAPVGATARDEAPEPIVAMLPQPRTLAPEDLICGALFMPSVGPARFVLVVGMSHPDGESMHLRGLASHVQPIGWLESEASEQAYLRYRSWCDATEIYEVGDAAAAVEALTATDGPQELDDFEEDDCNPDPLRFSNWQIERDPQGAITRALGTMTGDVHGVRAGVIVEILGRELSLSCTDADALSAWRCDLAHALQRVTTLTWLRQERVFEADAGHSCECGHDHEAEAHDSAS